MQRSLERLGEVVGERTEGRAESRGGQRGGASSGRQRKAPTGGVINRRRGNVATGVGDND